MKKWILIIATAIVIVYAWMTGQSVDDVRSQIAEETAEQIVEQGEQAVDEKIEDLGELVEDAEQVVEDAEQQVDEVYEIIESLEGLDL